MLDPPERSSLLHCILHVLVRQREMPTAQALDRGWWARLGFYWGFTASWLGELRSGKQLDESKVKKRDFPGKIRERVDEIIILQLASQEKVYPRARSGS